MDISLFSFFSGVGMLDLAFERNQYNIVLVNEYSAQFMEAYKYARQQLGIEPPIYGYYEKSAEYFARKRGKKRLNNSNHFKSIASAVILSFQNRASMTDICSSLYHFD